MIYDDYIDYTAEYTTRYGPQTCVFLQVGDFFELYAVHTESEKLGADIFVIADYCNLQVTKKNKSLPEHSRSNPYMAGFPLATVSKYVQILTQNNYTVVIIRQVTPPPNVVRKVTEIISPSTNLNDAGNEGTYLLTLYVTEVGGHMGVGMGGVDISTGHSFAYEAYSTVKDPSFALDEIYRVIACYAPKEIVLIGDGSEDVRKDVMEVLGENRCVHPRWNADIRAFTRPAYQNEVLAKAFPVKKTRAGLLSFIEACNLERMGEGRIAYVYTIQFAYEHSEVLVEKLQLPCILERKNHLALEYNSALQLNLISLLPQEKSLMQILNRCGTAFGSRMFRERLLAPVSCPVELTRRYDLVEKFKKDNVAVRAHKHMAQIQDLERMLRKMITGSFSPMDYSSLDMSMGHIENVAELLGHEDMCDRTRAILASYRSVLNLEECAKYLLTDIRGNIFVSGIHVDLDKACIEQDALTGFLKTAADAIGKLEENNDNTLCRLDYNDRDGYFLTMTKKRFEHATKKVRDLGNDGYLGAGMRWSSLVSKPLSSSSSVLRITNVKIQETSNQLIEMQRLITYIATSEFKKFVKEWVDEHEESLQQIIAWLAEMDVSCTVARNAMDFGYVRPIVVDEPRSFVSCVGLRHPIIERLFMHVDYVKNDIELGTDTCESLLLYGINASGKSSFMKAIGLTVIMAQSGMYVPCDSCTLSLYHHLFTRISGADNIYRGMSSFTVEMTELKNILHRCNDRSLVLGDELCAGTEAVSALAIVSAGIAYLSSRDTSFVFATHLHELPQLLETTMVSKIPKIRIAHMHIEMDGKIRYCRKLQDGQGSRVYGLEVCNALGLPSEFLTMANRVRRHVMGVSDDVVKPKPSRYNRGVMVDVCRICGRAATETHHIRYQKDAIDGKVDGSDDESSSGSVNVHQASNLVALCEECHQKEHTGQIHIKGYEQTSEGVELVIASTQPLPMTEGDIYSPLYEKLRLGAKGWKHKTKTGRWIALCHDRAMDKLRLAGCDLEIAQKRLYDATL